jgi:hypothetical protein
MANNACRRLSKGFTADKRLVNGIFKAFLGSDYLSSGCDFATQSLLPVFFSKYYDDITSDYKVNALWLGILNNDRYHTRYVNMPKIAFYCVEPRDNIFWRTLEWMVKDPNSVPHFQANSDLSFYGGTIAGMRNNFQAKLSSERGRLNRLKYFYPFILSGAIGSALALACLNAEFGITSITAYFVALSNSEQNVEDYQNAVGWFDEVNSEWEVITGAKSYRSQTEYGYECLKCCFIITGDIGGSGYTPKVQSPCSWYDIPFTNNSRICEEKSCYTIREKSRTTYHPVLWENDGVVTKPSASQLPCATNLPVRVYPHEFEDVIDKGSSHMQVRNDEGIKIHLNRAFKGEYGEFFYTEPQ